MRKYLPLGAVCCFLFGVTNLVRSADENGAKGVVDKAIKAAGGEAKLAKIEALTAKLEGKAVEGGKTHEFTMDGSVQSNDKLKLDIDTDGKKMTLVINGDKGYASKDGQGEDAPEAMVKIFKDVLYGFRLVNTPTKLKNPAITLAPLGETTVDNKPAVGVKVTQANKPDINIYFDKASGHPVRVEMKVTDPNGQEVALEFELKDYKAFDGVKHFTKATMKAGDLLSLECDWSDIKLLEKLDAKVFEKP